MLTPMSKLAGKMTIPEDLDGCQALIEQLVQTVNENTEKIAQPEQEKEEFKLKIKELLKRCLI